MNPRSYRRAENRMRQLVADLGSEQETTSYQAERVLIRYYGARALPLLINACESPNETVRFRAAWILGKAQDHRAFDAFLRLTADPLPSVRYDATLALGHLGDLRAIDSLIQLMCRADVDEGTWSAAIEALGMLGKLVVPALEALSESGDTAVLVCVAWVLRLFKGDSTLGLIQRLASHPDPDVRTAADEALEAVNEAFPGALSSGSPAPSE